MPVGVRQLTVLGVFKSFGLIAEALEGKPPEDLTDKYDYFLFHPDVARARDEYGDNEVIFSSQGDHELFMRGNRIIWSIGARVFKRFTLPSPVIMACWCHMGDIAESLLCILQTESLTIYNTSGELVSIPLPCTVTSIWPLPFGLLLQQVAEGSSPAHIPFSPSSPLFGPLGPSHSKRQVGFSPVQAFSHLSYCDHFKGESVSLSSHLILKDPLEELQSTYVEERGKLSMMKDFDERTIWSSGCVPLAASYNKGKMQHSVWVIEATNSNFGFANSNLPDVPTSILPKQFSFRRIWQGKGVTTAASKVFLATDDDASPIICFLLQEQKKLLSVRLQTIEINNDILFDIKPDMSWSIPAVAAEPVIVTHPGVKVGLLPYANIIALAPENVLFLYSGNQCLCRYLLPPDLGKGPLPCNLDFSEKSSVSDDLRIIGVADAVDDRINLILNNGQMFRCALRRCPSSSLANECILALSDGLSSTLFNRFLLLFWGHSDLDCVLEADSPTVFDWTSFSNVIGEMCRAPSLLSQELPNSSWEFLINSKFHKSYSKYGFTTGFLPSVELNVRESGSSQSKGYGEQISNALLPSDLLVGSLDLLHAVYESLKMDSLRKRDLELLAVLLCKIAEYLGEEGYLDHYLRDFPCLSKSVGICKSTLSHRTPPSLFRWLENCLQHGWPEAYMNGIPPLILKSRSPILSWARKIICFYFALCGAKAEASKLPTGFHCNIATGSHCTCEEFTVLAMVGEKFGLQDLDRLPSGVSLPLRHALDKCRESPPTDWPAAAYVLLGREDLALSCSSFLGKSKEFDMHKNLNLISMSTPYMLHLHPVTIPSTVSESLGAESIKIDDMDSPDGGVADGMEHIFSYNTQLRFGRDLRLNEVRRLLCSASPVAIQTPASPTASDQDLQQAQLWQLAQRTTTLPLGRGAFTLGTIYTLLTEAFTAPKLVLAGRLPAQQNATVNLDPNIRNIQELRSWPEFHNAVAAGLRLAPAQGKVSRTWVIYNKPNEPNAIHAGLLLALGLHGFLRVLTITDMFQYFAQEHDITTVGLMLGLAASYRGTMQPDISKSLYVHIPARHSSSVELELPTVLQSAALLSVGLLYEGSAHQQTMQILLGEIGRRSAGDNVLEREGYAVSAGFSLGLVALGRGEDALGFSETMVDRLFHYVGGRDASNERSLQLATTVDEQGRTSGQMMDGTAVNVDVTAPGAIMALALIYMKSDSDVILSRLNIPQTHFDLQYMRPDFILLRVLARNLIMWRRIHPSGDWIQSQIPDFIKIGIKSLREDDIDIDEMDAEAFVQAYVNIVAGACISLGLRFAGTKDRNAQELLYEYAMYFLNEIKPISATSRNTFPKGLSQYVDRGTLEICLHLIVLSLSVVMAGSGHLQTFRLLRFLRNRTSADGHANYGIQMAVSMAIGFLFLGGGTRSFSTSNSSIAALLITLYPRLPTGPNDNRCHLQAFRHLYVLATEARWLQTVDVGTGLPVYAPVEITLRETELYSETSFCEVTPCILPERSVLKRIRVCGPRYWPQVVELVPEDKPWWVFGDKNDPFNCGVLYIKRKVGACSYVDDPIGCQSLLSRAMHKVFSLTSLRASDSSNFCSAGPGAASIDQLVSAFSSDPSLIAFAQLCCGSSWNDRCGTDFQEFCLQILFECVSKDKPTLLQVYLTLYTTIGLMAEHVFTSSGNLLDSLSIPSIKVALAYNEALLNGRLTTPKSSIVQSSFLCLIRKRVEEMLHFSEELKKDVSNYLRSGTWPDDGTQGAKRSVLLSWHLQWYDVPASYVIQKAIAKIKPKILSSASVPFLRLLLPSTTIATLEEIDRVLTSSLLSK